jgi:hypothetical protein
MLTEFEGLIRVFHWTRRPQAVVPAASVRRKSTSTIEMLTDTFIYLQTPAYTEDVRGSQDG